MAQRDAWQAVVEALEAEQVPFVFGIPGNPRHLYDALYDSKRVKPVLVRHEASGVFMAMAYARVTGHPAVCFASPGPGVANLVPGLLEAMSTCSPVIALAASAGVRHDGMGVFQETDQMAMMAPVTKWRTRVLQPEQAPWAMRRAFSIATGGKPGPVYVELPSDVAVRPAEIERYVPAPRPLRTRGDAAAIEAAADLIASASRPLFVAGGGVILSGAAEELAVLAELRQAPVMTTPCGRGAISEDHPLALGVVGLYFTEVGEKAYGEADLLVTIGSRNEDFQTGSWQYFPKGAKLVQIDIDPFEIGRNWVPDVAVVGDAKLVLQDMAEAVRRRHKSRWLNGWRTELVNENKAYRARVDADCETHAVLIRSKRVVKELNRVFGTDAVLVNENGGQDLWSYYAPYYQVTAGGHCVAPGEQTCMGFGVAGAIGAKLAAPDKRVVCVTGDGAFQMFMKELPTAVQYHAPVTWVVLDNNCLGWPKHHQRVNGERYIATDFEAQPDFVAVANANACYGERVTEPAGIRPALERARAANDKGIPAVLDFIVEPWEFGPGFYRFDTKPG